MAEFPLPITIRPTSASSRPQSVLCTGVLRVLAGKRKVLDGTWCNRPVVAKVFADPIKARYHMKREWRGLKGLQERGLNCPRPLFCGQSDQGGWAVVTEKITDALPVNEVWDGTTEVQAKRELLCRVSRELAKYHIKGVLQKDLHLGNFLLQGEKLFAVDPSEMRFLRGEVDRRRSIWQLASLASVVPEEEGDTIASVCRAYTEGRSWRFDGSHIAVVGRKLGRCRRAGARQALKKCLRTSKRHQRIKKGNCCGVMTKDFFEQVRGCNFVGSIDELMERGQILKKGNTCFVSRISLAGKDVVVKRYNHRGVIHSIRHTIKKSRARHSWLRGHRLRMLNIATPRPLAYIEQRKGMLVWKSYIVTEYVQGKKLCDYAEDGSVTKEQRSNATQQVRVLLDKLGKHRITHGDLKHSNILITSKGPVLTDLDGMTVHNLGWTYILKRHKDVNRLERYLQDGRLD
ncbi:MAG: lipopolysaccharide kinase InaA family protein [Planctomycetota bacterium]|jgi:tRNA A-37 threonylcarbamoyl transferase component Bud32